MNKIWLSVAVVAASVVAAAAQAAEAKLAILDAQEVIESTNAAKRAVQTLTAKRKDALARIDALEKPLIEKQNKLREQQSVLSAEKQQQAEADFAKDLAKFRADAQAIQADLYNENMKYRKQIVEAVRQTVDGLAKEKGYTLVLLKGMVFYNNADVVDITSETLVRANKLLDK